MPKWPRPVADFEKRSRTYTAASGDRVTETIYGVSPSCLLWLVAPYGVMALIMLVGLIASKIAYG